MTPHQFTIKNYLNTSLFSYREYIRTIKNVTFDRNDILEWFKILCQHLTKVINLIATYYKDNKDNAKDSLQSTLLLNLSQTLSSLSFLINIFVKEEEIQLILSEARKSVIKQLDHCLDSVITTINSETVLLTDPSGNFVKWMDLALSKLAEIDLDQDKTKISHDFKETQVVFEEVLSHAMSIAQVSLEEDSKSIRGGSQSVLTALNSLSEELHRDVINASMARLFIDTCSDKLCNLERKVNTAVLKLCMKTFSQFTEPLEKIENFCFHSEDGDFDGLVADFDLHVDRIMQIGLFAVSCSSNLSRGIKIRSCLASLEALESELVPNLHSVFVEKSRQNENCAKLLMEYWLNQANLLKKFIYLIIDPFAFCQVIYEESCDVVDDLSILVKRKKLLSEKDLDYLIKIVKVLRDFLDEAQCEFTQSELDKVREKLKDFNDVVEEVETATKVLLNSENANIENSLRVLKRCKILLTVMKRLWYCFVDDLPEKNATYCKETKNDGEIQEVGNVFLDHIINRGKQILQDRSILYKSPMKNCSAMIKKNKEIPLLKQLHLRKLSFVNMSTKTEPSLDLQITNILNEITNLSTTFTKNV